ncbi:hypothetical protein TPHA_0F00580 [Tetrapisispora phaffii CBS 4417]|uniref:non-specific serine/threonine protein kinase n=1 Tax=Tetrapisispora phaffii (strain ATCC 24235 / CBS 4417 / NBRC 1672 / NRRL Y-8282 / UCD 70-5) TaxID=1071381 RepID=G8BUW3_TETPH|nr:hypothetical protein TPHA_0F00580 [Tetrapisispora phaffii CBS 4417]CCE63545.1 hypothetical protein TPHA_0F00580 [Tetrapisispora phaffii CBS 4417]
MSEQTVINLSPRKNFIAMVISDSDSDEGLNEGHERQGLPSSQDFPVEKSDVVMNFDSRGKKDGKEKSKDKKRWSFMSTYSSSSSLSKKRKSTLSSNNSIDNNGPQKSTPLKMKSISPQKSNSPNKRTSMSTLHTNYMDNDQNRSLFKRSSTSSSLKQLIGKFNFADENHENRLKHSPSFNIKAHASERSVKTSLDNNKRKPLAPLASNVVQGGARDNTKFKKPNDKSLLSLTTTSTNVSIDSKKNWKFWKKNSQLSRSTSSQSVAVNQQQREYSNVAPTLKKKSSLSSLFSSSSTTYSNVRGSEGAQINDYNLRKKSSTSNLSIKHLKHKTSQSSLQNFKVRRKTNTTASIDREASISGNIKISLPTPDTESRNKIDTKLNNSNSLMSIKSHISSIPVSTADYKSIVLNRLLEHCDFKYIINDDELNDLEGSIYTIPKDKDNITDYISRFIDPRTSESIISKQLSLDSEDNGFYSPEISLHELICLRLCQNSMGLPFLLQAYLYRKTEQQSDKLYLMLFMKDSGEPLHSINISDWEQVASIFWQCTTILYVNEIKLSFEHRNLILQNILIDRVGNITLCDFKGSRLTSKFDTQVLFTRLDHPLFYQGGRNGQYEIYEMMRTILPVPNSWSSFEPRINLLWLYYLITELLKKGYANNLPPSKILNNLIKLSEVLNPHATENITTSINSTGDLLKLKELF